MTSSPHETIIQYLTQHGESSGAKIGQDTMMGSGTLYPALYDLEQLGRITARWSWPTPLPHPRRRLYKLKGQTRRAETRKPEDLKP